MAGVAPRRIRVVRVAGALALLAAACNQTTTVPEWQARVPAIGDGRALPAVVDGVPLLDLAKHAIGAADAYGVTTPVQVRAVVTTQAALAALVGTGGDGTGPEYVIELQGRFSCGSCDTTGATASPPSVATTTTTPAPVPVTSMVLEVPVQSGGGSTTGIAVGVGGPKLAALGRAYDLDPYVMSLAGVAVPPGPFPG